MRVIQENCQYVTHILEVILCCSQQGLPLRGHREVEHVMIMIPSMLAIS